MDTVSYMKSKKKCRMERAQGMLEFALTLPILLTLLLGIMEFSRLMYTYVAVVSATREAARYGAASGYSVGTTRYYQDCNGIRQAAMDVGQWAGVENNATSIRIEYDNGPTEDTISGDCPVGNVGPILQKGDRIEVTVSTLFTPTQGLVNIPSINITSTVRRTIVVDVPVR